MLPDFPKLRAEVHEQILTALRRRIDNIDPILSKVRRFTQHEGRSMRYERIDAPPAESGPEEITAPFQVLLSDVPDLVGRKLHDKLEEMAQELAKQQAKMFFRRVAETCDEVGNSIHANGQPLTAERILEMLERVQMNFGPDGKPTGEFVIHPDMAPAVKKAGEELERDPELKRRHDEIVRRKREEWVARESNRKLVD